MDVTGSPEYEGRWIEIVRIKVWDVTRGTKKTGVPGRPHKVCKNGLSRSSSRRTVSAPIVGVQGIGGERFLTGAGCSSYSLPHGES